MDNDHEKLRLEAVRQYLQLDFNKSKEFQDIVDIAVQLCDKPVALITLLDEDTNWLKVKKNVDVEAMPRDTSFCQYCIQQDNLFIVPDAAADPRFDDNPLVHVNPKVRFYAGAPLVLDNGLKVGTLCLLDLKPGNLNELQQKTLAMLARQVIFIMQLEMSYKQLREQADENALKNESLRKIAHMQSHDIRQPLTSIMGLVNLVKEGHQQMNNDWLKMLDEASATLDERIRAIVNESMPSKDLRLIRLNRMVEEIEDYAILILDKNGLIENWNKGAEKIKGYKAHEIIGKSFEVFYTEEDKRNKRPYMLMKQAIEQGAARDEGWRIRKDGTRFWGSILITTIHNDNKEVIGFTKVTRDLTNMRKNNAE